MRAWIPVMMVALLLILPEVAYACPVCFDANDENRQAFIATAALLTLLPLGMVGGAGLWMRKRLRAMDDEDGIAGDDDTRSSDV